MEQLLTKTCTELTHPAECVAAVDYIRNVGAGAPHAPSIEKRYIRSDGSIAWANVTTAAVREPDGDFKYFISVVEDISERKQLQERMLHHQAILAHVDRVSLMGEMATAIAHEINQPLAAISNYAGGAIRRLQSDPEYD